MFLAAGTKGGGEMVGNALKSLQKLSLFVLLLLNKYEFVYNTFENLTLAYKSFNLFSY